jgi:riboflavin synthase
MFAGIVETIGRILRIEKQNGCFQLTIMPLITFDDLTIGDSVSVNGVCLTVTTFSKENFTAIVVPETLRLTNLGHLTVNDPVNLERALRASDRIGGHYLQGHVEGIGNIIELSPDGIDAMLVKISLSPLLAKYIIHKGYIAIDGMSITVIEAASTWFTVTFIPHTQAVTITRHYKIGSLVNIETDMMGKYIEKMLGGYKHAV